MNDLHILKSGNPDIIDEKYASLNAYPDMMGYIMETYSCACPRCHEIVEATEIF